MRSPSMDHPQQKLNTVQETQTYYGPPTQHIKGNVWTPVPLNRPPAPLHPLKTSEEGNQPTSQQQTGLQICLLGPVLPEPLQTHLKRPESFKVNGAKIYDLAFQQNNFKPSHLLTQCPLLMEFVLRNQVRSKNLVPMMQFHLYRTRSSELNSEIHF